MGKASIVLACALALVATTSVSAIDNGRGATPPMGWRSWNFYAGNVNQQLMESVMAGMVSRKRSVDGVPTSLCDLGYCDVGLDDAWQKCGQYGADKYTYHTEAGFPVVNVERFPDFIAMTTYAHKLGLTAGWYLNNCICKDHCGSGDDHHEADEKCYVGDVAALFEFGFDSVKLDGCSKQRDLDVWARLFNQTGRPITIENCHWGDTTPTKDWCPWNFFRTSQDIQKNYGSIMHNLQTTVKWATEGLSRPGCWGYPDMLEVGCGGSPGLSAAETRTHFGAWCIVSSPLTLSHDVHNDTITDAIWPLISNKEAIAVNQAWHGHSGSPFAQSNSTTPLHVVGADGSADAFSAPLWQYFYKPLDAHRTAVLLINNRGAGADLSFNFADVPGVACSSCAVRDVWLRKDLGAFAGTYTAHGLASHDSAFLILSH